MSRFPSSSLRSSREVRLLGVDVRLASNDEPEPIDRGPLPEVSESDWAAFEVARTPDKAERWHQVNDAAAVEAQLVDFRSRGLL